MKKIKILVVFLLPAVLFFTCVEEPQGSGVPAILNLYAKQVDSLMSDADQLVKLVEENGNGRDLQNQFLKARNGYKKIEWLTEYFFGYTSKFINGPALEEVEADEKSIVILPEGFQVVEEYLFPEFNARERSALLHQVRLLRSNIGRLKTLQSSLSLTKSQAFDALRLQIFRIVSLGISGFDSPIANNSIPEATASVKSLYANYVLLSKAFSKHRSNLHDSLNNTFRLTFLFLEGQQNFNAFDRARFIADHAMPLANLLVEVQKEHKVSFLRESRLLQPDATNLFDAQAYNADFFTPDSASVSTTQKVKLGEQLFYSGALSGNGKRSCGSCHRPDKAFTDGASLSLSFDGKRKLLRNTPTLLNAALQPALFYDTRVNYLEDQAGEVVLNKDEMHGSFEKAAATLKQDKSFSQQFQDIYGTTIITGMHIRNALATYVRSLIALNSRFDQFMHGKGDALDEKEQKGFNIFMGKGKCGTCHFVPLFNGSAPPYFDKIDAEIIGVPSTTDTLHPMIDRDKGKYNLYKIPLHAHAFKTPTLRNIALTAPYMHNGVYKTLEEVVEFYNRGGGVGLGLKIDNQTLPPEPLHLTKGEKKALILFMHTLTDTAVGSNQ